jgi:hypothetical protein
MPRAPVYVCVFPGCLPHSLGLHSEKDLDEVLQTTAIFSNVGKGVMAAQEDLQVRGAVCDAGL